MPTESLLPGVLNGLVPDTPYAIPPGAHWFLGSTNNFSYSTTFGGVYTALSTPNVEPGVLLNGGFVKNTAATSRSAIIKKVSRLLTYAGQVAQSNPIGFWRLNEQSGLTGYDSMGNYHLTYGSGVTLAQAGPITDGGYSASFDGTANGDAVSAAINPWNGATAVSFEAWVFSPTWAAGTHEVIINLGNTGLYISVNNGFFFMSIQLNPGTQFTNTANAPQPPANEWVHLAGTWESGDQTRMYINGKEVTSYSVTLTRSGTIVNNTGIYVGNLGGSAIPFSGLLANVALYLRKLTATEVMQHYIARNNKA